MICASNSELTVEYHEGQTFQRVRETVASTKRENLGVLESSSGGSGNSSSNLLSKHPRISPFI